jgi:hypothetical protein
LWIVASLLSRRGYVLERSNGTLFFYFGSGLAGACFSQFAQWLFHSYNRPRLHVAFGPNEDGCVVDTKTTSTPPMPQHYLRLKVLNTGRSVAQDVEVSVTTIRFAASGQLPNGFRHEVLDLPLALDGRRLFRIAREGHRFVDLAFTTIVNGNPAYGFAFLTPNTLVNFGFGVGQYSADILISADACKSRRAVVDWSWDGTFAGLNAIGTTWRF